MNENELKKRRTEESGLEFSVFTHHYFRTDQEEEPTEVKTYVDTGFLLLPVRRMLLLSA
jgi:hypothetical protein